MDCQHCAKGFSEIREFSAHSLWHTECQARLGRGSRKYSIHERPPSTPTDQPASSQSNVHARCSAESISTVGSPHSPSIRNDFAKIPDFDFGFGTISPISPASGQIHPPIKTLNDILARFPSFEIENRDHQSHTIRDYKCADCEAVFSTQKDCDAHTQSRSCPGSAVIAFALYRDLGQPGGYRIDKKYLPFDGQQSCFKCKKCHLSFSNRLLKRVHEHSHPQPHIKCLHCAKPFSTAIELESHYQWHDDMEFRHHRNECRRKLPGLKLQSKPVQNHTNTGVADFGRKSVLIADEDLDATPGQYDEEGRGLAKNYDREKELVAISFISPEDLERIHAPNGFLREVEPGYLHDQMESRMHHVVDALDALEGRFLNRQASACFAPSSIEKRDPSNAAVWVDGANEATKTQPISFNKRSSIWNLFRRTRPEPQPEPNLKRRSSVHRAIRGDSITDRALISDGLLMLSSVLRKVSTAANKGDLKAVRKVCDRFLAATGPSGSDSDPSTVPVHAYEYPEGYIIRDAAGNSRYISPETINEITSALRHTPVARWAKTKISVLSTRAYLSTKAEEYEDAVWCYEKVLTLLRQHPMLFPDVIWHAAILSNLAHLSARLSLPDDEESYYLKALAISYNRYGRKDLNNINFLTALAALYEKNNQTTRASEVYKRSLFARMELSGPGEIETLMAMQELAAIHCKLGGFTVAQLLYEQCLGGFEMQLGLDHKVTLLIVDRLSDIYFQLQAREEALALYLRVFPYLRTVSEVDEEVPRKWLSRYIQHAKNFDFPQEVSAFLQDYRTDPSEKDLRVLQSLARVYMLAGLLSDALEAFEFVYNARRKLQGGHDPAALDALHGQCLALECMDDIDAAHFAYTNLRQMALQSSDTKDGKTRALDVRARLVALQERRKMIAGEKEAWGLKSMGPCGTCKYQTNRLCQKCHISRFCCEACRDLAYRSHGPACHPSVTLCQSKSVTAVPGVPPRIEKQAIESISHQKIREGMKAVGHRVSNSFTFNYDPRNFTTFRVKLNSLVDTYLSFDHEADVRTAILSPSVSDDVTCSTTAKPVARSDHSVTPASTSSGASEDPALGIKWSTPHQTPTLLIPKGTDAYLLVAPGEKLFQEVVEKRRKVRMRDSEGLEKLVVPDEGLIGYCQGLMLQGLESERCCYLVEVQRVDMAPHSA